MLLRRYIRARNWPVVAGYGLFIGMMAVGYFYNITFVQLGLVDLGGRVLGLRRDQVVAAMALLALVTMLIALGFGEMMTQRGWGRELRRKLQLAGGVVLLQSVLTAAAPFVPNHSFYLLWILVCSLVLGVGVPVTFSLTVDLIPVADRGYIAAAITAIAYLLANLAAPVWQIGALSRLMLQIMLPGAVFFGLLLFFAGRSGNFVQVWVAELAQNREKSWFAHGRFHTATRTEFRTMVALMFGIFFVDSLGFLRIVETPMLVDAAWQSASFTPRLVLGGVHLLAALSGGILYTHLPRRHLFYWIFGIFALTHFTYSFRVWLLPETTNEALGAPVLYATAVSLYTVLNFALWADYATPQNAGRRTAIGVALSGWSATFLSTGLALWWQAADVQLITHLQRVNAIAQLFFLLLLLAAWRTRSPLTTAGEHNTGGGG